MPIDFFLIHGNAFTFLEVCELEVCELGIKIIGFFLRKCMLTSQTLPLQQQQLEQHLRCKI